MTETRTLRVHVRAEGCDHAHGVEAASFEAAAVAFMEIWRAQVDADGQAWIIVRDADSGVEHGFGVDFDTGETAPCQ